MDPTHSSSMWLEFLSKDWVVVRNYKIIQSPGALPNVESIFLKIHLGATVVCIICPHHWCVTLKALRVHGLGLSFSLIRQLWREQMEAFIFSLAPQGTVKESRAGLGGITWEMKGIRVVVCITGIGSVSSLPYMKNTWHK